MIKKRKISQFIGRQLSRIKAGQSYYMIFIGTVTAISVFSFAFQLNPWIMFMLIPSALFLVLFIGYFMDKSNVVTMDQLKTFEMTHRYLNTADMKNNEFRFLLIETLGEWMKAFQENRPIDLGLLKKKNDKFKEKWNPPEDEKT